MPTELSLYDWYAMIESQSSGVEFSFCGRLAKGLSHPFAKLRLVQRNDASSFFTTGQGLIRLNGPQNVEEAQRSGVTTRVTHSFVDGIPQAFRMLEAYATPAKVVQEQEGHVEMNEYLTLDDEDEGEALEMWERSTPSLPHELAPIPSMSSPILPPSSSFNFFDSSTANTQSRETMDPKRLAPVQPLVDYSSSSAFSSQDAPSNSIELSVGDASVEVFENESESSRVELYPASPVILQDPSSGDQLPANAPLLPSPSPRPRSSSPPSRSSSFRETTFTQMELEENGTEQEEAEHDDLSTDFIDFIDSDSRGLGTISPPTVVKQSPGVESDRGEGEEDEEEVRREVEESLINSSQPRLDADFDVVNDVRAVSEEEEAIEEAAEKSISTEDGYELAATAAVESVAQETTTVAAEEQVMTMIAKEGEVLEASVDKVQGLEIVVQTQEIISVVLAESIEAVEQEALTSESTALEEATVEAIDVEVPEIVDAVSVAEVELVVGSNGDVDVDETIEAAVSTEEKVEEVEQAPTSPKHVHFISAAPFTPSLSPSLPLESPATEISVPLPSPAATDSEDELGLKPNSVVSTSNAVASTSKLSPAYATSRRPFTQYLSQSPPTNNSRPPILPPILPLMELSVGMDDVDSAEGNGEEMEEEKEEVKPKPTKKRKAPLRRTAVSKGKGVPTTASTPVNARPHFVQSSRHRPSPSQTTTLSSDPISSSRPQRNRKDAKDWWKLPDEFSKKKRKIEKSVSSESEEEEEEEEEEEAQSEEVQNEVEESEAESSVSFSSNSKRLSSAAKRRRGVVFDDEEGVNSTKDQSVKTSKKKKQKK